MLDDPLIDNMLDTIKFGIPLTEGQYEKLRFRLSEEDRWQWVQQNLKLGEIRYLRHRGLFDVDLKSYHREIFWDIPDSYRKDETFLVIELSVPKFWYGHNIHLLYDFLEPLKELKKLLEKELNLRVSDVETWQVFRADVCYAWRCDNQRFAEQILASLKKLHFPYKQPMTYPDGILFKGKTYSFKFYLKLPEFKKHDKKALIEDKARYEWINHLESKAEGVIRCEANLKRRYLKLKGIETIGDLARPTRHLIPNDDLLENYPEILKNRETYLKAIGSINSFQLALKYPVKVLVVEDSDIGTPLNDGDICSAPAYELEINGLPIDFKGGSFTVRVLDNPTTILQYFLDKYLGSYKGMDTAEQVKLKLLEKYKPVKAARLMGFWLYVQRFGSQETKAFYGHNSYYVAKRDLKSAEVSLLEPSKAIEASQRFLDSFRIEIPSSYATNRLDDFRDSDNLLNLPLNTADNQ